MYRRSDAKITELCVAGLARPVALRRSPRARRLSLRVNEAKLGAVLTLPLNASLGDAGDFLARHFDWLQRHLDKLPQPIPFEDGALIPLRGLEHELRYWAETGSRGKVWTQTVHEAPPPHSRIWVSGKPSKAAGLLANWFKDQARQDFSTRVAFHAEGLAVRPKRITIRDQTTRWGSCSSNGTLSFSWRLLLTPAFVLDYVAAHEVAHLRELNHGARFWRLVHSVAPRTDEARIWLKKNGPRLHQYGAAT
jgi:predicted metal-dependent hydrolase